MPPSILIAEHSPPARTLLRYVLADEGYDVQHVDTGRAAFHEIVQSPPDIVLLNVDLPGMDGPDLLRQVMSHEQARDVSFIMIALDRHEHKVAVAFELGATDVVPKPLSRPVIVAAVRNVLRLRAAQTQLRRDCRPVESNQP